MEFWGELLEKKRKETRGIEFPPGLVAPAVSGVAGLSATAGVDEGQSPLQRPKCPVEKRFSRTS